MSVGYTRQKMNDEFVSHSTSGGGRDTLTKWVSVSLRGNAGTPCFCLNGTVHHGLVWVFFYPVEFHKHCKTLQAVIYFH